MVMATDMDTDMNVVATTEFAGAMSADFLGTRNQLAEKANSVDAKSTSAVRTNGLSWQNVRLSIPTMSR